MIVKTYMLRNSNSVSIAEKAMIIDQVMGAFFKSMDPQNKLTIYWESVEKFGALMHQFAKFDSTFQKDVSVTVRRITVKINRARKMSHKSLNELVNLTLHAQCFFDLFYDIFHNMCISIMKAKDFEIHVSKTEFELAKELTLRLMESWSDLILKKVLKNRTMKNTHLTEFVSFEIVINSLREPKPVPTLFGVEKTRVPDVQNDTSHNTI